MARRPKDKRDLWLLIWEHFGLALPAKKFTRGHSSPFDFLADAFLHPSRDVAAWANRSGIKTLGASILAALEFAFTDNLRARVLAGSEDQAGNLYEYWCRWAHGPLLQDRIQGRVGKRLTKVAGGSLEILTASQKRVRGPKVQRLFRDEIDETDPEILAASVGMLAGTDEAPGRIVDTSTWHRAGGSMARLVAGAQQSGIALHKWNLWESLETCGVERHQDGKGCDACALEPVCRAKAAEYHENPMARVGIAAECCGLFRIDDAIKNFRRWSKARWEAEAECRRPTPQGLVYPEFDEVIHRCENPPAELKVYRSIDWGCGVFVCLWIGQDRDGLSYLLDTYRAEDGTLRGHADWILAHRLSVVEATYCDPAGRNRNDQTGRSNVEQFRSWGIPCSYSLSGELRDVHNGIQLVRGMLRPACGQPRFYYVPNENNRAFVRAMQAYHNRKVNGIWIDDPQDPQEYEHIPDTLRYYVVNRQKRDRIQVVPLAVS